MGYQQYRYFARNESGRDLFFIELDDSDGLEQMYFTTSLGLGFQSSPELEGLITDFCKAALEDDKRNELVKKIITSLIRKPGIEDYFFPEYLLSSTGSYLEFADNVVSDIVLNSDYIDFTPFSEEHHPLVFGKLRLLLNDWHKQGRGEKVDEPSFLCLLPMNEELQHLFVSHHSDRMEFYKFNFVDDSQDKWAIYGLFNCTNLAFSFSMHID